MQYRYLTSTIQIGRMTLKNRTVMTAIQLNYAQPGENGGFINDRIKAFYAERAAGGVGMIIVGGVATDEYLGYKHILRMNDDRYVQGFQELVDLVHSHDTKLCVQLMQTGRYGSAKWNLNDDQEVLSASSVFSRFSGETPREMTVEEIRTVIDRTAEAAARVKKAGCDAVELVGNSGYMINQFLSPLTNQRTDAYGGSLEKRCRFGLELIAAVKKTVGDDFPIILRIAGNDFVKGSNGPAENLFFCQKAEKVGIDAVNVTGGWHETKIPQLPGDTPRGAFAYLAAAFKNGLSVPVISSNRHNDPREAEKALATGESDLIGQCRALVAEPHWFEKAASGRESEIRKCVACNQMCFARFLVNEPVGCLLNADAGREQEGQIEKAKKPKKLLVIGAGPAGCEFAYRAAAKGHKVTLWEKEDRIGGKGLVAALPPAKYEFYNISAFHQSMLQKYGVEVVLGKSADVSDIREAGFDEVIVSSGAIPNLISLGDHGKIPVCHAEDILMGKVMAGKNVLVIGGGSVGCETAHYMAHEASLGEDKLHFMLCHEAEETDRVLAMMDGCSRAITVIDLERTASNYDPGCAWTVLKDLKRLGVKLYSFTKIKEIKESTVVLERYDKDESESLKLEVPCDTIVQAVGYRSDDTLVETLKETGIKVHRIGDALKVGKISDAIQTAAELAKII